VRRGGIIRRCVATWTDLQVDRRVMWQHGVWMGLQVDRRVMWQHGVWMGLVGSCGGLSAG
jgi:hypothetical protein